MSFYVSLYFRLLSITFQQFAFMHSCYILITSSLLHLHSCYISYFLFLYYFCFYFIICIFVLVVYILFTSLLCGHDVLLTFSGVYVCVITLIVYAHVKHNLATAICLFNHLVGSILICYICCS